MWEANMKVKSVYFYLLKKVLADTGVLGMRACSLSVHFLKFRSVFKKKCWNNMLLTSPPPAFGVGAPSSGKSWILRHWREMNVVGITANRELIRDLATKS